MEVFWPFVQRSKVLGRGGYGVVYEGVHKHTGQLVALKVIQVLLPPLLNMIGSAC